MTYKEGPVHHVGAAGWAIDLVVQDGGSAPARFRLQVWGRKVSVLQQELMSLLTAFEWNNGQI